MCNFTALAFHVKLKGQVINSTKRNINIVPSVLKLTSKACGSLALVNMTPIELIETWLNGCKRVACNVSLGKRGSRGYTQATEAWASQATWWPMKQSEFFITEHDAIICPVDKSQTI